MRDSTSLLFKAFHEFVTVEKLSSLPKEMRGIYALYQAEPPEYRNSDYDSKARPPMYLNLVYVGMTDAGAKGRIGRHAGSKKEAWSHCSIFEVWDNITQEQIVELEALLRHMLRRDSAANSLNIQKGSGTFAALRKQTLAQAKLLES